MFRVPDVLQRCYWNRGLLLEVSSVSSLSRSDLTACSQLHICLAGWSGVVAMMGILLKGQPDNVQALFLRGKSYFYLDDQSMAKRHFGEALKYDPEHKLAQAEFSKVRKLYKHKAQVSKPFASTKPPDCSVHAFQDANGIHQVQHCFHKLAMCPVAQVFVMQCKVEH